MSRTKKIIMIFQNVFKTNKHPYFQNFYFHFKFYLCGHFSSHNSITGHKHNSLEESRSNI